MSVQTATNRFIVSPLQSVWDGLYQHLFSRDGSFQEFGNRLVRYAEHAQAIRQVERVQEAGQLLASLPLKEYQLTGRYYLAWCDYRNNIDTKKTFERIAEYAPAIYRARALQSLAAIEARKQDYASELRWLVESMKVHPTAEALRGIAIVKAKEGFNRKALDDLESMLPLARISQPVVFYSWLNSLATELGEVGRKQEARNISRIVLASPFAHVYPQWQETAQGLKEPDRAFISVTHIERKPVQIQSAATRHANKEVKPNQSGRVVAFPQLKEVPEPERPDPINMQEFGGMTLADKKEFILKAVRTALLPESEYDRLIYLLGLIKFDPASDILDLEDKALLHNLIQEWCYTIDPEELAGVISALRDCKDDQRRESIMDDIISLAYQHTPAYLESESAWRRKVERRLPNK